MTLALSLVLFMLMLATPPARSSSQTAAAAATPVATGATPIAAIDCTVTPRTAGYIAEIITDTDLANATPMADPAAYLKPDGTPADGETLTGVTETVQQLVACVNAGDFLAFLALFSTDALHRYAVDLDLPLDPSDERLTPVPEAAASLSSASISDAIVLADGRVSILVHIQLPSDTDTAESPFDLQLILIKQDDRWLIDELVQIAPAQPVWTPVSGDGYAGVIVDAESAAEFAGWLHGDEILTGWEPTADDIAALEAALPGFLKTAPQAKPDLWERLPTYKRQYAGFIDATGHTFILVNAFCDASFADWQSEPVLVLDGGDCFFQVDYDPATGLFSRLMINGEA